MSTVEEITDLVNDSKARGLNKIILNAKTWVEDGNIRKKCYNLAKKERTKKALDKVFKAYDNSWNAELAKYAGEHVFAVMTVGAMTRKVQEKEAEKMKINPYSLTIQSAILSIATSILAFDHGGHALGYMEGFFSGVPAGETWVASKGEAISKLFIYTNLLRISAAYTTKKAFGGVGMEAWALNAANYFNKAVNYLGIQEQVDTTKKTIYQTAFVASQSIRL